jgi:hypothetical protein
VSPLWFLLFGAVGFWIVSEIVGDIRAGAFDPNPKRLDISTALERQRRLEQNIVEQRALELEAEVIRKADKQERAS